MNDDAPGFSVAVGIRGGAERHIWCWRWRPTAVATLMAAAVTACGGDEGIANASNATHHATPAETPITAPAHNPRQPILIKTLMTGFQGEVLAGSVIGASSFCPGGTVRHEHGSLEIGYPAINVFRCTDGKLQIGFGPGPDQMNNAVQTSSWKILDGSGRFAGMAGHGQMKVRFEKAGASKGQETFKGQVVVP